MCGYSILTAKMYGKWLLWLIKQLVITITLWQLPKDYLQEIVLQNRIRLTIYSYMWLVCCLKQTSMLM